MLSGRGRISDMKFKGLNLLEAYLNGNIVWQQNQFYVNYEIELGEDDDDLYLDTMLQETLDKSKTFYPCLPEIKVNEDSEWSIHQFTKQQIVLKDGRILKSFAKCKASDVKRIRLWFPPETYQIRFRGEPYYYHRVKNVKYLGFMNLQNCNSMFLYTKLETINTRRWNTSNVIDMSHMFYYCEYLKSIDLSSWNTDNVTDMSHMFSNCILLENMDLSHFRTDNVTDLQSMFEECNSLMRLNLSNWDVTNVTNTSKMFSNCTDLKYLYLCNWDIRNLRDTDEMFKNVKKILDWDYSGSNYNNFVKSERSLSYRHVFPWNSRFMEYTITPLSYNGDQDILYFNTSTIGDPNDYESFKTYSYIPKVDGVGITKDEITLYGHDLIEIDVNSGVGNVGKVKVEFSKHSESIKFKGNGFTTYLSDFLTIDDTSGLKDMSEMFYNCTLLKSVNLKGINTENVTNMSSIFYKCESLELLDISDWNTGNVKDMSFIFSGCSALNTLLLDDWVTDNVNDMSYMFANCSSVNGERLGYMADWNTSSVTNMSHMFENAIDIPMSYSSNWNTSSVTNMSHMFMGLKNFAKLNWDTRNVKDMSHMFRNIDALQGAPSDMFDTWDTSNVENMSYMFNNCRTTDKSLKLPKHWNTSSVTNLGHMFEAAYYIYISNLEEWDTSNVENMSYMFSNFENILPTKIDLTSWKTDNVKYMQYMFNNCTFLEEADFGTWNTSNVTNMSYMFYQCTYLTKLNASSWNTSNVGDSKAYRMFMNIPVPSDGIDFCYDGTNYQNWNLTEKETGYAGTFPWNK